MFDYNLGFSAYIKFNGFSCHAMQSSSWINQRLLNICHMIVFVYQNDSLRSAAKYTNIQYNIIL